MGIALWRLDLVWASNLSQSSNCGEAASMTEIELARKNSPAKAQRGMRLFASLFDLRAWLHLAKIVNFYNYTHIAPLRKIAFAGTRNVSPDAAFQNPERILIGHRVRIGSRCHLGAGPRDGHIRIGDDVLLGPGVLITAASYRYDLGHLVTEQPMGEGDIVIGNDVWFATRAVLLPGTTIGDGSIVAAGAVVRGEFPPMSIIAGSPAKVVSKREIAEVWPDFLVAGAAAWSTLALFMTTAQVDAFTSSVAQISDTALAYFFARAAFRSLRDLRIFLLLMLPGLAIMGGVLVFESITHNHVLQPLVGQFTGQSVNTRIGERLGFMRARGPFPHPILAGIFFASFLPLYWLSGLRGWPLLIGIAASISSFFTVSSAALLALAAGTGLVVYNWLSERIANLSWRMFFIVGALFAFVLEFGTKAGAFSMLMRFASLNSYSAYNRVLIWRYGTENVQANPWFGIGFADWDRPSWMKGSIDHYWLLQAIQFGVIPPLFIAIACAIAIYVLARRSSYSTPVDGRFERGIAIAMAVFAFGIVSVAIWLSAQAWFFMLLGITVSLGHAERRRVMPRGAIPVRPIDRVRPSEQVSLGRERAQPGMEPQDR